MTLGITTRPGKSSPRLMLVVLSLSSKTKQLLARGKMDDAGNTSCSDIWNCAVIVSSESFGPHDAIPIMASGKSDMRRRVRGA